MALLSPCETCNSSGRIIRNKDERPFYCPDCNGEGYQTVHDNNPEAFAFFIGVVFTGLSLIGLYTIFS